MQDDGQDRPMTADFRRQEGEAATAWLARLRQVDAGGLPLRLWDALAGQLCSARLQAGRLRRGG